MSTRHISVLLQEVLDGLSIEQGDVVVDATLGGGGYSSAILSRLGSTGTLIGMDQDAGAVQEAQGKFQNAEPTVYLVESNFRFLSIVLKELHVTGIDKIVFDLGLSSDQLEQSGRGFSFQKSEPLDMRMNTERSLTAREIVNTWDKEALAGIFFQYGEERYARKIAEAILLEREMAPIVMTRELVSVIEKSVPGSQRHGKTHPATKVFQALRIAVNDELEALHEGLEAALYELQPNGKIAVVSFHSLEDRIVKHFFRQCEEEGKGQNITKKPIIPSEAEVKQNPRSRSAKLRIFQKA